MWGTQYEERKSIVYIQDSIFNNDALAWWIIQNWAHSILWLLSWEEVDWKIQMFCFNYSSSRHPALCPTTVDAPHHGNNINVFAVSSTDSYGSIFNWFNVSSMSWFLKHWKHNFGFLVRIQVFNRSLVCWRTIFCCEIIFHHTLFLANYFVHTKLPSAKVFCLSS